MKRLRSSDDLDSYGEKWAFKDWGRKDDDSGYRTSSHRSFYYKSESGRKGLSASSPRYDRLEDDRESSRLVRKRSDYDGDSYDRRKNYDGYRDGGDRGFLSSSPRGGYGADRIYRSESFCGTRREFPKWFRSERDRSRREGNASSWRRFGGRKDYDDGTSTRSSGDSVRGSRMASDGMGKARSPQGLRDAKSPPWSKDSGSERSKSTEVKKSEDLPADSGSSEMEEGELEPDTLTGSMVEHLPEDQASAEMKPNQQQDNDHPVENKNLENEVKTSSGEKLDFGKECNSEEELEAQQRSETVLPAGKKIDDSADCQTTPVHETSKSKYVNEMPTDNEVGADEEGIKENINSPAFLTDTHVDNLPNEDPKEKTIDTELKGEQIALSESKRGITDGNGTSSVVSPASEEGIKDKGKSVAGSSSNGNYLAADNLRIERESRGLVTCKDNEMERHSSRGFEFFISDRGKKVQKEEQLGDKKPKDEKLALEPLDLSLSLPNVLLPIGTQSAAQAPGSSSQTRSMQSLPSSSRACSDGYTASMSFSGSQLFTHNPSCSLTHNSFDNNEQSVKSRPLFQGVDWQALSSDEHKNKDIPMYLNALSNGNGSFHQYQMPRGILNGQALPKQNLRVVEGSSKVPISLDHQLSFTEQLSGAELRLLPNVRSPAHSAGSHENGSEHNKSKVRVIKNQDGGVLGRSSNQVPKEQPSIGADIVGADIVEQIIVMVISEPLHAMTRKFSEMTVRSIACLRESTRDIILNPCKRWQLSAFQKALENRSDITLDMLLKSHRAQLEVMVALKTGVQEFLDRNNDVSSSDMAEVFLNLRCRNPTCRNLLPVDECDCKICTRKNGFCSNCMCLVCSKFDNALNTCSWVGCDICQHWCHADCGVRESYIRNGRSANGTLGTTEIQFHCLACGLPSEMYGFVKEVFQNFVKEWTAESLAKELDYVRRIFCTSEDFRGRRLYENSIQMMARLTNKSDLLQVQNHILGFLAENDYFISGNAVVLEKEQLPRTLGEGSEDIIGSSQEAMWLKSVRLEKAPHMEKPAGLISSFDFDHSDKVTTNFNVKKTTHKEPVLDELESIARIKQAEAKMFQSRSDEARREAEGLKRIAITKNDKVEEEYANRVTKLRLPEAEEMHRQKLEELRALEKAHQEYFNLKTRMEADIKDLLLKMEATRRGLSL